MIIVEESTQPRGGGDIKNGKALCVKYNQHYCKPQSTNYSKKKKYLSQKQSGGKEVSEGHLVEGMDPVKGFVFKQCMPKIQS